MSMDRTIRQRGIAKTGCLIAGGAVLLVGLILVFMLAGRYNSLVSLQEKSAASWSEIDNQYKRRFDLIPQLIATVKGVANFEKSTLEPPLGSGPYRIKDVDPGRSITYERVADHWSARLPANRSHP